MNKLQNQSKYSINYYTIQYKYADKRKKMKN